MKKIVLTSGLIAGAIMFGMFLLVLPFHEQVGMEWGMVVGYTSMVLAFLMVYFGVRRYRDEVAGGRVGFLRAWGVGLLIAFVGSTVYVASWQVIYFGTSIGDKYMAGYQESVLTKARAEGATEAEIAAQRKEMEDFAEMYQNPLVNAAITYLEPLPVALIMSLVSAGLLSRRRRAGMAGEMPAVARTVG